MRALVVLLLLCTTATGCDRDGLETANVTCSALDFDASGRVSATVDAAPFDAVCLRVEAVSDQLTIVSIDALPTDDDRNILEVMLPSTGGTHDVSISLATGELSVLSDPSGSGFYEATAGMVTVEQVTDRSVRGTFWITLENAANATARVREGEFDVSF